MAEPFETVDVEQGDRVGLPDPRIQTPNFQPSWQVGPRKSLGETQVEEAALAEESGLTRLPEAVQRSFRSGGNFGVQIAKQLDRAYMSGAEDPGWDQRKSDWLKQNRALIDEQQDWRYMQTRNQTEAEATLMDAQQQAKDIDWLSKRAGVSTFVAEALAGIVDIDAPISFMTGGLASTSKIALTASKAGRIAIGATAGAASVLPAAEAGYLADPNGEWANVPLAGLAGAIFGGAGASLARRPMQVRDRTIDEFVEHINDGAPRAQENIHKDVFENNDPYGTDAFDREMALAAEADIAAAKAEMPAGGEPRKPAALSIDDIEMESVPDHETPISSGERVQQAAVRIDGKIYTGIIHADAIDAYEAATGNVLDRKWNSFDNDDSGFVTSTGRYVTRAEAQRIADAAEQPRENVTKYHKEQLLAEELVGNDVSKARRRMSAEERLATDNTRTVTDTPRVFQPGETSGDAGSIGARNLGTTGPGVAAIRSTRIQDIVSKAKSRVGQLGIALDWTDGWRDAGPMGKYAQRFSDFVNATPIATDFARMMNSGSAVAQTLAYDLLENASGIIRNGRSGARIMEHYNKELLSRFSPFNDAYAEWASVQGAGFWQRNWDSDMKARFNTEVTMEMQGRFHDGANHVPNQNKAVIKAADALDATFAREVEVVQGRPNEKAVKGTEQLKKTSGYMPQKWLGRNILRLQEAGTPRKNIVDALAEGYQHAHPSMTAKDARIYADAAVGRAEKYDQGVSTNLIGLLQEDGRFELADILRRQGMSEGEVQRFIDRMTGLVEERGAPAFTKARLDVDMRFVASNGVKLMDLIDNDFSTMVPRRVRRSAGRSALARKGIGSRADWEDLKNAILEEQRANGPSQKTGNRIEDALDNDKHVDAEFIDNLYTYFSGDPIAGGISPMYSRMKKLTNLALLNQLGLTQLAELGPTIASVGLEQFFRNAGEAIVGELRRVDSPLVQELKHLDIFVPEERLFRDDLVHEFEKSTAQSEWGRTADKFLNKASRLQGYTSGFYAARRLQQRIAVTSAADKLAKHFRDGGLISDPRLYDMGLGDNAAVKRLEGYVKNGVVQFDAKGNLVKLNMDQWAPEDADLFTYTLNAATNTLVQKAMAGESSMLFHKDGVASLFWHLKSFPMLALEKQALRTSRFMDAEAMTTFLYGLGTAAAAYTVRQAINGRTDRLGYEEIAKGAFGYSNLTGWIPMWTDPLAGMLGMDSLKVGGYAGTNQIISVPASFTTLDKMARIPGAAISSVINLGPTNSDINALTSAPLVGNAYGFSLIFNAIRQSNNEGR